MGYKRMKKRKMLFDKKSKFGEWLRNFHREKLEQWNQRDKEFRKSATVDKKVIKAYVNIWDFPYEKEIDDAERLKWFESPNAEGYLDM